MRRLARGGETSRQQTRRRPSVWDTRKLHDPAVMRRDRAAHRRIDSIRPADNARLISCAGNFLRDRIGELLGARRVRALRAVALASSHRSHLIRLSSLRSPPDFRQPSTRPPRACGLTRCARPSPGSCTPSTGSRWRTAGGAPRRQPRPSAAWRSCPSRGTPPLAPRSRTCARASTCSWASASGRWPCSSACSRCHPPCRGRGSGSTRRLRHCGAIRASSG